jgi:hypothetical protein
VERLPENRLTIQRKTQGKEKDRERLKKKWIQEAEEDLHRMGVIQWRTKAKNMTICKQIVNKGLNAL